MAMFSHDFVEKDKDIIDIKEVDPVAMDIVLSKVYSDDLRITEENSLTLLQTASMFQFTDVEKECMAFIERTLSADTCLRVLQITDRLSLKNLFYKAQCFAFWEFSCVKKSDAFLELSIGYLESYLASDLLRAKNETEVFEAAISWVEHFDSEIEDDRLELLPRILSTVRFASLHAQDLKTFLLYPTISSHSEVASILQYIISIKEAEGNVSRANLANNLISDEKIIESSKKLMAMPVRAPPLVPCVVGHVAYSKASLFLNASVVSGDSPPRRIKSFRKDNPLSELKPYILYLSEELDKSGTKRCKLLPLLPISNVGFGVYEPSGYKVANVGKDIFISGGQNFIGHGNCIMSIWRFKTLGRLGEGTWCQEGTLLGPRRHHTVLTLGDSMYLIGGFGKHRVLLDSMEKYSIPTGEWHKCSSMPEALYSAAACVFEGNIYVVGSQVYCYHTLSDSWVTIRELKLPKHVGFSSAMAYKEWIYLTGMHTNALMRFSPRYEVEQKKLKDSMETEWSLENVGNFNNKALNTCIVGSKIYSFGLPDFDNEDSTDNCPEKVLSVEIYDIDKAKFEVVWTGGPSERMLADGLEIKDFMTQHCAGCFSMIKF
ncbi:kelch-like protein 12 isoform X2 [Ischnura elegans]|nr:kelch-like protein 12 isoform X2 [Ischnura elegans]